MVIQTKISSIKARQIFDSRGNPTIEVDLYTELGLFRSAVPSGASTGIYEALELRDKGKDYHGKGVSKAIDNINNIIAKKLVGLDPCKQEEIDKIMVQELDGSKNENGWTKSKLGANAILGVSLSVCRAGAKANSIPLYAYIANLSGCNKLTMPIPSFNIINGGTHAGNGLAMQEFMILPVGAKTFAEAMKIGSEVYHHLKSVIKRRYGFDATNVGDEGGFAPNIKESEEALDLITEAIKLSGHKDKIKLASDIAASEFYNNGTYDLKFKFKDDNSGKVNSDGLLKTYKDFVKKYPFIVIEDPYDQQDWKSWEKMTKEMGKDIVIVGDDLLVTNPIRVKKAIDTKACNGLLLKVNQIGTITESIEAVNLAKAAGWKIMTSHRSGETEDTFIADLAVGFNTTFIKTGAPCRSERLAKYNQLLRIEEELGDSSIYAGNLL